MNYFYLHAIPAKILDRFHLPKKLHIYLIMKMLQNVANFYEKF